MVKCLKSITTALRRLLGLPLTIMLLMFTAAFLYLSLRSFDQVDHFQADFKDCPLIELRSLAGRVDIAVLNRRFQEMPSQGFHYEHFSYEWAVQKGEFGFTHEQFTERKSGWTLPGAGIERGALAYGGGTTPTYLQISISYFLVIFCTSILPLYRTARFLWRIGKVLPGHCRCGYDLRAHLEKNISPNCPECGTPIPTQSATIIPDERSPE